MTFLDRYKKLKRYLQESYDFEKGYMKYLCNNRSKYSDGMLQRAIVVIELETTSALFIWLLKTQQENWMP